MSQPLPGRSRPFEGDMGAQHALKPRAPRIDPFLQIEDKNVTVHASPCLSRTWRLGISTEPAVEGEVQEKDVNARFSQKT
jgi:hypothetical protein